MTTIVLTTGRQIFVSISPLLLLFQSATDMRRQSGTTYVRALLLNLLFFRRTARPSRYPTAFLPNRAQV